MKHTNTNGSMADDARREVRAVQEQARAAKASAEQGYREGMREGSYVDRDTQPSSDEIRRDIGRTRTELDRTLTELERRLSPEAIVDRVVDHAMSWVDRGVCRAKTSGGAERLAALGRSRAVPLTLLGLGAGWLAAEMFSEKRAERRGRAWEDDLGFEGSEYAISANAGRAKPPGHSIRDDRVQHEELAIRPVYSAETGSKLGYEQTVPGGTSGITGPAPIGPGGPGEGASSRRGYARDDDETAGLEIRDAGNRPRGLPYDYSNVEEGDFDDDPGVGQPEMGPRGGVHAKGMLGGRIGQIRDRVGGMGDIRHRAGGAAGHVRERASSVWDSTAHAMSRTGASIRDNAEAATSAIAHQSRVACERASDTYDRHPLTLGAVAFGVGLLAALALPASRRENRWFGEESDELYRRAKSAGREAVRRGREAAEHVGEAALEGAGVDHLRSPREVVRAAREAVEAAAHTAAEEAKTGLHEGVEMAETEINRRTGGDENARSDDEGQQS